jgi:SpoVK/Ycf46/Vps4 family AAA+-type ATPase
MLEDISTIITTFVGFYLPVDMTTNFSVYMAINKVIVNIIEKLWKWVSGYNTYILTWIPWFNNNYLIIDRKHPAYSKITDHMYLKYNKIIKGCRMSSEYGKNQRLIDKLIKPYIVEQYKNHKIKLEFSLNKPDTGLHAIEEIKLSSKCSTKILDDYLKDLIKLCNSKVSNEIYIYKIHTIKQKKTRTLEWKEVKSITSKNTSNTIVSDKVQKYFFDTIKTYMNNELYYINKGLSYTKGFLLHGPPGCGKTSVIKVIANIYKLPIFLLDLSIIKNNAELLQMSADINKHINPKQKYLLVLEDVNRCDLFKYRYRCDRYSKISEDCLLNILDGVEENYGRITIMTGNDIGNLKDMRALIRPGRIDSMIELTYCDKVQIRKLINLHLNTKLETIELKDDIQITPAKLIQILRLINDVDKIIKILNTQLIFGEVTLDDIDKLKISETKKIVKINKKPIKLCRKGRRHKKKKLVWGEHSIKHKLCAIEKCIHDIETLKENKLHNSIENNIKIKRLELDILTHQHNLHKLKYKYVSNYNLKNIKKTIKQTKFKDIPIKKGDVIVPDFNKNVDMESVDENIKMVKDECEKLKPIVYEELVEIAEKDTTDNNITTPKIMP